MCVNQNQAKLKLLDKTNTGSNSDLHILFPEYPHIHLYSECRTSVSF